MRNVVIKALPRTPVWRPRAGRNPRLAESSASIINTFARLAAIAFVGWMVWVVWTDEGLERRPSGDERIDRGARGTDG